VLARVFRALLVGDAIVLGVAALIHVWGIHLLLGSVVFDEPQIIPAAIVEGLSGIIFAVTAYAVLVGKPWAWPSALVAHVFAILGFLVGIWAVSSGFAPNSPFNYDYHRIMLGVFVAGLLLLLLPIGRSALGGHHGSRLVGLD
jgi:hypothetical protein